MLALVFSFVTYIYDIFFALYRDFLGAKLLIGTRKKLTQYEKENSTVYNEFQKIVRRQPNKPCIISNEQTWTFKDVMMSIYVLKDGTIIIKFYKIKQNKKKVGIVL